MITDEKIESLRRLLQGNIVYGNQKIVICDNHTENYGVGQSSNTKVENMNVQQDEELADVLAGAFYGNVEEARRFISRIRGMNNIDIIAEVKMAVSQKRLSDLSCHRDMWEPLYKAGIYSASESNWNKSLR